MALGKLGRDVPALRPAVTKTDIESYRQRAAAVIAGYRTRDLTFRTFRNEALEQYRTLFDLASRYTYLAAKSYDYAFKENTFEKVASDGLGFNDAVLFTPYYFVSGIYLSVFL